MTIFQQFLEYKRVNRGRATRTIELYSLALDRLEQYLAGRDPVDATADDLVVFCGPWLHRTFGIGPDARATHVSAVREFYAYLHRIGQTKSNEAKAVEYPKRVHKIPIVLTLANAEKLLWAPDFKTFTGIRDAAILGTLMGVGLRVSALVGLNEGDLFNDVIDRQPRLFMRIREKGGRQEVKSVPRDVEIFIRLYLEHPELKEIDRHLPGGDQVLFVSTNSHHVPPHEYRGEQRRLRRDGVQAMMHRHAERVGVPLAQAHPHAARHLFGTELAEDDVDPALRQRAMSHVDPKSTTIYTHIARRKLTKEIDRANPLAKMRTPASALLQRLGTMAAGPSAPVQPAAPHKP
jgi:integrase/recombinase XerD